MLPSIYSENLFDDFFSDPFDMVMPRSLNALYGKHGKNLMKTDVRETEDTYELDIDLPGFKKDEVNLELKDGYLTIQAAKGLDKEEPEKKGKYIRQERYAGACSRSFYVGEHVEGRLFILKERRDSLFGILSINILKDTNGMNWALICVWAVKLISLLMRVSRCSPLFICWKRQKKRL